MTPAQKTQKSNERSAKMMSIEELADTLRFFLGESRKWANGGNDKYLNIEVNPMIAILTAELERRDNGGKVLADTRKPYMTDGEYLALGMEPPDDNN